MNTNKAIISEKRFCKLCGVLLPKILANTCITSWGIWRHFNFCFFQSNMPVDIIDRLI